MNIATCWSVPLSTDLAVERPSMASSLSLSGITKLCYKLEVRAIVGLRGDLREDPRGLRGPKDLRGGDLRADP